jgi:hypothetical protein
MFPSLSAFLARYHNCEKRQLASLCLSVSFCPSAWNTSAPTERNFMKFDIWVFFENLSRKLTRITGTLHYCQYTFFIISRSVLLIMRNALKKSCRENQNTRFMFRNFFPSKIMTFLDNVEKYCTAGQSTDDTTAHAHFTLDKQRIQTHTQNM